jgi:formylglycine-generating enzyme required for sulfatase activity
MRSQQELLDASGYGSRLKDFDDLLHILDNEIRLITPTDPEGRDNSEPATLQAGAKYYQLTHDYLVPSLRDWLTRKQKETCRGRAQLRLTERAVLWTSKPQNRYLPAWWEWANIRLFTRRKDWTAPQKKMMRQAGRFHALRGGMLTVALIALSLLGYEALGRLKAQHLRERLLIAKIDDVPAIVAAMDSYRRWVQGLLQQALVAAENQDPARQLRLRLALSHFDDSQFDPLYERLFGAEPEELGVIRDELKKRRPGILAEKLRQVLESDKAKPDARLWAACALAGCDTLGGDGQASCWLATAPFLVNQLLTALQKNPSHYRPLVELLRPVSTELVKSVAAVYGAKERPDADRALAASLLTEYAPDRPEMLANLLLDGSAAQFGIVFDKLNNESGTVRNIWIAELARPAAASASADVRDALGQRQANAAVALLRTGHGELVWPLLKHRPDPTVRSYLTNRLAPMGADPGDLIKQLSVEPDVTVRRALLLSLGEYRLDALPAAGREAWPRQIAVVFQDDPDPGVHGAAEWLLRRWQQEVAIQKHRDAWARDAKRREQKQIQIQEALVRDGNKASPAWYVNSQGQTMVVLPGPGEFMMGSPTSEVGHFPDETLHQQRIGRSFAVMDTSVTVEQFDRFLKLHPETRKAFSARAGLEDLKKYSPEPGCPMMVTWFMAAEYCNWLSAQEGIPREQWCYEPNTVPAAVVLGRGVAFLGAPFQQGPLLALSNVMLGRTLSGDYGEGMKLTRDYLHRSGYRFPTEAEWEYACRALASSRFHFGEPAVLLDRYARYNANSADRTWPVAGLKPNEWGFFDMHGNMFTWCIDRYGDYAMEGGKFLEDNENTADMNGIHNKDNRVMRGGAFVSRALDLRSAFRERLAPNSRRIYVGFRPARTLPL